MNLTLPSDCFIEWICGLSLLFQVSVASHIIVTLVWKCSQNRIHDWYIQKLPVLDFYLSECSIITDLFGVSIITGLFGVSIITDLFGVSIITDLFGVSIITDLFRVSIITDLFGESIITDLFGVSIITDLFRVSIITDLFGITVKMFYILYLLPRHRETRGSSVG